MFAPLKRDFGTIFDDRTCSEPSGPVTFIEP